uniref:DH domain-containing protein n=1 Tax=Oryzias latipes TaxID=8090 RepID=A0A3P9MBZ3_ORYLA
MEAALRTRDSAYRRRSDSSASLSSTSSRRTLSGLWASRKNSTCSPEEGPSSSPPVTPQHTPLLQRLFRSSSSEESADQGDVSTPRFSRLNSSPSFSPPCSSPSFLSFSRRKLRHIVEEMVTTEREYVRSLHYIIHHYFPEMDRADLPQDLRGKRSIVFGNLEKLLDFHSQFFLKELEACWRHPLRVPVRTLEDKMDLSSYLLKPIQRMSKYALLLTDLMKEVGVAQEAEVRKAWGGGRVKLIYGFHVRGDYRKHLVQVFQTFSLKLLGKLQLQAAFS